MAFVEQALVSRLLADPTVSGSVGNRIHPQIVPQDSTYPAISYSRISSSPVPVLSGTSGLTFHRFQVNAWSPSYSTTRTLASGIRSALDGKEATMLLNDIDLYDESARLHYCAMDFMIAFND